MELEAAKEILAEVFHARSDEVEESWPEEREHVKHECERQKYFIRSIVHSLHDKP